MRLSSPELPQRYEADPELGADKDGALGRAEDLDVVEQESLLLNLDASLRVHARPHFFSWTQGLLQSLIRHEVLICALSNGEPLSFSVDSFATNVPDPSIFSEMFLRDASVASSLIKLWEGRRFRPVVCDSGDGSAFSGSNFVRELERIGATRLVAHGTHDADGLVTGFFTFACTSGADARREAYLAQLVVPFLHAAWVRTQLLTDRTKRNDAEPTKTHTITPREQEILRWIYLGKSNFEIGAILNISPLTVKNHVQKILRKLNVVNRAQAVGKALELRILNI